MNRNIMLFTLFILLASCTQNDSDYYSVYDTRHPSERFIIDSYEMYEGLDVPSRFVQNGDTAVVYQLSVNDHIEYKMWNYMVKCGLGKGELETSVREVNGKTFNISRLGLDGLVCEQSVLYGYID